MPVNNLRVLVLGGGDIGSAVAHHLFRAGARVLVSDRAGSPHARRGMAFTDALFEGAAELAGVSARLCTDLAQVEACWSEAAVVPIVVVPEAQILAALRFDVIIEATMRRYQLPPDVRSLAPQVLGLGPGYTPGQNCHVAIETQWGPTMGTVLHDRPAAPRTGGPRALDGVTRERFVISPCSGTWSSAARLGQAVRAGDLIGQIGQEPIHVPIDGHVRGLTRNGIEVAAGQRVLEIDPRSQPQVFGLGERPEAIARGVLLALEAAG